MRLIELLICKCKILIILKNSEVVNNFLKKTFKGLMINMGLNKLTLNYDICLVLLEFSYNKVKN